MSDDRFMHSLRGEPRREFTRGLWQRLGRHGTTDDTERARPRLVPALALAAAAMAIVGLFAFPSMRASAQAFLDLFRVRSFVAVSVDATRFERLKQIDLDLKKLIGDRMEVIQDPGEARPYDSAISAGAAAGIRARTPTWLPSGLAPDTVMVTGEGRMRITADAARLRELMNTLDVRNVDIPTGLDGARVEVHAYPAVEQSFRSTSPERKRRVDLLQARSPEVALPAGLELARVAEIGLRVLGMSETEARRLADRTDWRSTLLVPVPIDAGFFQEVEVAGARGLVIAARKGSRHLVVWSKDDQVFALGGNVGREDLLRMANSVQ